MVRLPALFVPHSASLGPATATRVLSAPVPVSTPPTGLDERLFFISLVSDFLAVRFSVSSGCARRRSVSNYAAILVLRLRFLNPGSMHHLKILNEGKLCLLFLQFGKYMAIVKELENETGRHFNCIPSPAN